MNPAIPLAILFLTAALAFLYSLDLVLFFRKENKMYQNQKGSASYGAELEKKMKRKIHPQKKNYLLFLYCKNLIECGEIERANLLFPLVRPDLILGIEAYK